MLEKIEAGSVLVWSIVGVVLTVLICHTLALTKVLFPEFSFVEAATVVGSLSTGAAFMFAAWQYHKNIMNENHKHHFNEAKEDIKNAYELTLNSISNEKESGRYIDYIIIIGNFAESINYHIQHLDDEKLKQSIAQKWLSFLLNNFKPNLQKLTEDVVESWGVAESIIKKIEKENDEHMEENDISFTLEMYNFYERLTKYAIANNLIQLQDQYINDIKRELNSLLDILKIINSQKQYQIMINEHGIEYITNHLLMTFAPLTSAIIVVDNESKNSE